MLPDYHVKLDQNMPFYLGLRIYYFYLFPNPFSFPFQLGTQNQDLMATNLELQDRLKELEKRHSSEVQSLERCILREMCACFAELESLVQVCAQCAEGQDPNISVLLGPKRKCHVMYGMMCVTSIT